MWEWNFFNTWYALMAFEIAYMAILDAYGRKRKTGFFINFGKDPITIFGLSFGIEESFSWIGFSFSKESGSILGISFGKEAAVSVLGIAFAKDRVYTIMNDGSKVHSMFGFSLNEVIILWYIVDYKEVLNSLKKGFIYFFIGEKKDTIC